VGIGAAVAIVALVALASFMVIQGSSRPGSPRPSRSAEASPRSSGPASGGPGSSGGSQAGGSVGPSAPPGGKVAEALIKVLHATPFQTHFDEAILASSLTGATRITLTANASGDVSGQDVAVHTTGTGNGPPTDEQIVTIGNVAWTKAAGATAWDVNPRSAVSSSVDGLLNAIRLIDDPNQIADLGVETVDGQSLHHLTGIGAVAYNSIDGVAGDYDTFDVWTSAAGVPVKMHATFSDSTNGNQITGSIDIAYSKVGDPITITAPAGAPTLAP
jgi:hypothetical protein